MLKTRKFVKYIRFVFGTKGVIGFFLRIGMIVGRFDLSGNKMKKAVLEIERIGKKYKYKPALIIPALVLKRHRNVLSHLSDETLEFAVHGYTHRNFKHLSLDKQVAEIKKAKDVFKEYEMPVYGFRAPYLSLNSHTTEAVQKNNLLWESDETVIWNGFTDSQLSKFRHFMANAVHLLYSPLDAQENVVIARLQGEVVHIPVTLPDDEILIDRLGIKDPNEIENIWTDILKKTHQRGDIFVLQLHPERFSICKQALDGLLNKASYSMRGVWVTGMKEVAEWWKEKSQFKFTFQKESKRGYRVHRECTNRTTVLGRNLRSETSRTPFYKDYHIIEGKEFFIESKNLKPCIGLYPKCPRTLLKFLEDEGFPYEVSESNSKYSLFLAEYETFARKDEMALLSRIEENPNPIVRYWRWPDGMKSAFVTTHDLDCLTLTDFLFRAFGK